MSLKTTGTLILVVAFSAGSCAVNEGTISMPVQKEMLINKPWESWQNDDSNMIGLPGLVFHDSTVIGHSRADTVFYFSYKLRGHYLILKDARGRIERSRIMKIDANTFTVDKLWFLEDPQTYHRRQFGP